MNNNNTNTIKKRDPFLSALLSFISLGLGQFYNGEFLKGAVLNLMVSISFLLLVYYNFSAYFGISYDLIFLLLFMFIYFCLKGYSVIQAYTFARKRGPDYRVKKLNKLYIYLIFFIGFLIVPISLVIPIRSSSLNNLSGSHPFRSAKARSDFLNLYQKKADKWPVLSDEKMVKTSFGDTFVRVSGKKDLPPLVLMHGGGSNSLHWIPNIKTLSENFRIYAIDNIFDFGKSVYSRYLKTSNDLTTWLDQVITALDLDQKVNIIGLSYGGWVTSRYMLRFPQKISKAILISPFGTILPITMEWVKRGILCLLPHKKFIRDFTIWALENGIKKGEISKQDIEEDTELSYYAIRCFKPKNMVNPFPLTDLELASIHVPTLFMAGEKDKLFSAEKAVFRINRVAPGIRTEVIPGAGHAMTLTKAELINSKIIEFLNRADQ